MLCSTCTTMQRLARKGCQGVPGICVCMCHVMLEWLCRHTYIKSIQTHVWHFVDKIPLPDSCPWLLLTFCWFLDARVPLPPCRHSRWNVGHRCQRPMSQTFHAPPANEARWPRQVILLCLFKCLPGSRLSSCSSFRARSKAKSTVPGPVPVTKVLKATAEI